MSLFLSFILFQILKITRTTLIRNIKVLPICIYQPNRKVRHSHTTHKPSSNYLLL